MKLKKSKSWETFFKFNDGNRYPDNYLISIVLSEYGKLNLKKRKKINILDLGFGAGASNLIFFAKEKFNIFGIDNSNKALVKARKKTRKIINSKNILKASFDNIPFENKKFDLVIDCRSLQHINNSLLNNSFKEITRVLKKSGKFISFFINFERNKSGFYTNYISKKNLMKMIKKNFKNIKIGFIKFSLSSTKKSDYIFWIVRAEKK